MTEVFNPKGQVKKQRLWTILIAFILAFVTWIYLAKDSAPLKNQDSGIFQIEGKLYARRGYELILISGEPSKEKIYRLVGWDYQLGRFVDPRCTYQAKLRVKPKESKAAYGSEIPVEVTEILEMNVTS